MSIVQATIKVRRGDGWPVRPVMDVIDGQTFNFIKAGPADDGRPEYAGETAWMFYGDLPEGAPAWIASGDLVFSHSPSPPPVVEGKPKSG
ncbi:hypothetical protein C7W88_12765 [Novosphingobium sp. THN1]|uniref:hypothetical protein n=1 Tax=Novosphingobium sp. THN1 TaxID=1016987 RepID=UPI000E54039E|nr:hypothetical protein [Novosphingobium sp. THN1]AXU19697.1 hypothetical protein C7W88_12765 [Novosphingobium sp. THN1]